jgi:hypothetical protein
MAIRTYRLNCKIWGNSSNPATVTVNYNGNQVFSNTVSTIDGPMNLEAEELLPLISWEADTATDVGGLNIPVSVTVQNGSMLLRDIVINQMYAVETFDLVSDSHWPAHMPASALDVILDWVNLTDADFETKYGQTKAVAYTTSRPGDAPDPSKRLRYVTTTRSIEDNFIVPNLRDGRMGQDPRSNILVDGEPQVVAAPGGYILLENGDTLTMNYNVDLPLNR